MRSTTRPSWPPSVRGRRHGCRREAWISRPIEVDRVGASDAQHFLYAIRQGLVLITRNHDDLLDLHEVGQGAMAPTMAC